MCTRHMSFGFCFKRDIMFIYLKGSLTGRGKHTHTHTQGERGVEEERNKKRKRESVCVYWLTPHNGQGQAQDKARILFSHLIVRAQVLESVSLPSHFHDQRAESKVE